MAQSDEMPDPPRHIAIIMDGNGRWARARGKRRATGHKAGAENVSAITTECARLGVGQLTLYAFSIENWQRPKTEVAALMRLLRNLLPRDMTWERWKRKLTVRLSDCRFYGFTEGRILQLA